MHEPGLELFDLGSLVENLNSALANPKEVIRLEPSVSKEVIRLEPSVSKKARFNIIQTVYEDGTRSRLELEYDINLGHISVVAGWTKTSTDYENRYEALRLRTKRPLELADGKIIPSCCVNLYQERWESAEIFQERQDYIKKYGGLVSVKADLRNVLPTEWFLGGISVKHYTIQK